MTTAPNDLYLNEKKLAGILIEMVGKTGDAAHIVIGIGLNIAMSRNYETNINQARVSRRQINKLFLSSIRYNI